MIPPKLFSKGGGRIILLSSNGLKRSIGAHQDGADSFFQSYTLDDSNQGPIVGTNCNIECNGGQTGRYQVGFFSCSENFSKAKICIATGMEKSF